MAGVRVLVQRRTVFSYPSNFAASSSALIPLGLMIPTLGWKSGVLEVINYSQSISGAGATVVVAVANAAVGSDGRMTDPQSGFVADVTIPEGTAAVTTTPRLYTDDLTAPIGSSLSVYLQFNSAQAAASGNVEIEVYLVGRDT